ncbi:MAG: M24 family metallopeptidase [Pseudomonadota bacterium]
MHDVYLTRLAALRARMAETGTDLVALGPSSHLKWLAGVDPHGDERPILLLVSQGYAGFLMPALNADAVRQATDLPFHPWADDVGPDAALADALSACDVAPGVQVALDETMRADFALLLLDALDSPRRSFTEATVGQLRARKDAAEVALLTASARLNDAAVEAAVAGLKSGMTELDVAQEINAVYRAHGAQKAFTIVGFGANGAFPHHHTSSAVLQPGMAVLIDTGCRLDGYPSDMTRSFAFGARPDGYAEVRATVEAAVQAAIEVARPGVRARDVDRAARQVIEDAGYGPYFVHRLGHGMGIDVHEPPWITASSDTILEEGHVFSIEPGIYLPGRFGVRLEDIVVLRADGPEVLSGLPRLLPDRAA